MLPNIITTVNSYYWLYGETKHDHLRMNVAPDQTNILGLQIFLSDPSPIIVYPCHSLTRRLTNCCLVNFIDVTLACEDGNSKLVEVVTVANVDDEDRAGNSLLQIWELRFGHKAKLLFRP